MATTTNFGWETPDDTDLVKDGAAAIRTALGGVDTSFVDLKGGTTGQVLAKASNTDLDFVWSTDATGMTNPMTTTGDTIYSSSGSTPARLGIGTSGQVLTVSGGVPGWASPSSAAVSFTNISTTTVNTGTSYTISGLSGYDKLRIFLHNVSQNGTTAPFLRLRFNSDSGANYYDYGAEISGGTTDDYSGGQANDTIAIGRQSTTASDSVKGYIYLDGCKGTTDKIGWLEMGASGTTSKRSIRKGFRYDASAEISSVTIYWSAGDFDAGTVDIWGSVN
jgi:hypothetical protein